MCTQKTVYQQGRAAMNNNDVFSRERAAGVSIDALSGLKILLGGAGNTGSHFVERAVRNFIGNVFIVDFDKEGYQPHNFAHSSILLNPSEDVDKPKAETLAERANEKLLIDGKYIGRTMDIRDIGPEIIKHFDYALGFFDNVDARKYLYENARIAGVPFIETGLTDKGAAQIQAFNHDADSPCYCCTAPKKTLAQSCTLHYENDIAKGIAPVTDVSGAIAADIAVQSVMNIEGGKAFPWNSKIYYDPEDLSVKRYNYPRNPSCDICNYTVAPEKVIYLEGSVDTVSYDELTEMVQKAVGTQVRVCLPDRYVEVDYCPVCGAEKVLMKPERRLAMSDVVCPECIGKNSNEFLSLHVNNSKRYSGFEELPARIRAKTLFDLGFSYGAHILATDCSGNEWFFTLKDDIKIIEDLI